MSEEKQEEQITREKNPAFFKMWDIMCVKYKYGEDNSKKKFWNSYEIYAKTTKDISMSVWNGNHHPTVEANIHPMKFSTLLKSESINGITRIANGAKKK